MVILMVLFILSRAKCGKALRERIIENVRDPLAADPEQVAAGRGRGVGSQNEGCYKMGMGQNEPEMSK
jgi:hypothetical protein